MQRYLPKDFGLATEVEANSETSFTVGNESAATTHMTGVVVLDVVEADVASVDIEYGGGGQSSL